LAVTALIAVERNLGAVVVWAVFGRIEAQKQILVVLLFTERRATIVHRLPRVRLAARHSRGHAHASKHLPKSSAAGHPVCKIPGQLIQ